MKFRLSEFLSTRPAPKRPTSERIPLDTLLCYGVLGLPLAALTLPVYIFVPKFYASELGLGLSMVGVVLLASRLTDVLTDPVVGALSDRLNTRYGRRRPWLVIGAPVVLAAVYYLFMPGGEVSGFYLLAWTMLLYLGWTMMLLPYATWGAELSPFYHQRSRVFAWRESFFLLGTIFATGVSAGIGFADQAHSATVLIVVGWGVILMLPTALALTLWRVPELPPRAHRGAPLGWRNGLIVLQHNHPFRRLIAAYLLMGVANGLPATLFLLYAEHVVERPDAGGTFLFVFFLAAVVGIPFWLRLSYHIGKHRAWATAMTWGCIAFVWVPFVVGPGDYWLFFTFCVVAGLSLGADMMLPYAMQADVVDQDTVDSGDQRTGVYFGLWNMATKLALALAVGFGFPLLDAAGFQADGDNSEIAIWALALLYGFAPVCFKLVAIAIVWNHPLDERRQALLRGIIEEGAVGATRPGHRR